jgi:hypothetical protein
MASGEHTTSELQKVTKHMAFREIAAVYSAKQTKHKYDALQAKY